MCPTPLASRYPLPLKDKKYFTNVKTIFSIVFQILETVFWIRILPDPKLFGLKDLDLILLISDPALDLDPPLVHTKLRNNF